VHVANQTNDAIVATKTAGVYWCQYHTRTV